jgi:hypothetical protein
LRKAESAGEITAEDKMKFDSLPTSPTELDIMAQSAQSKVNCSVLFCVEEKFSYIS